jgi:hypothetical protein
MMIKVHVGRKTGSRNEVNGGEGKCTPQQITRFDLGFFGKKPATSV